MYYYGGYQGYGNACCNQGGYGGGYGVGYGAAIILVLFILLVIIIGSRAFGGDEKRIDFVQSFLSTYNNLYTFDSGIMCIA